MTDYWKYHGIKNEYSLLTDIVHKNWSNLSVKKHKKLKNLTQPSQNLRNFMSEEELLFTSLAEMATKRIGEKTQAFGFAQNRVAAEKGGKVAKNARIDFEEETGVKVVSPISSKDQSITNERLMG